MTKIAVRRPVTTFMIILIFVAFGLMSLLNLSMDLLPNMDIPVAVVYTTYIGASPEQIQQLITEPIEQSMARLDGLDTMVSQSSENVSFVILQFEQGVDLDMASLDMREAVDLVKRSLPDDASDPTVLKMDVNSMSAIYVSISSETDDLVALKTKVDDRIADRLVRQEGVASVDVSGGREREIRIDLIEDRIRGYGINEATVSALLKAENSSMPVGSITEAAKDLTIKVDGEFTNVEEIKNIPVNTSSGSVVYIRDIADVTETYKEVSSYSYLNGQPAVTLSISKQSTANTVNVSNAVMRELDNIIAEYPELEIKVILDPADYITASLSSVATTAVSGIVLAIIVLFVFLRNVRSTLVVGAAIPLSILVTFTFMFFAKMTLNLMSLGGLTLGVGMLVDNSIVVLESVFRRMEEGEGKIRAAINGATEVAMSIVASTLTTVAVFVPVAWLGGMIAQIFNDLALSIAFSLAASLLVSLTFVPLACSLFLSPAMELEHHVYLTRYLNNTGERSRNRIRKNWDTFVFRLKWLVTFPKKGGLLVFKVIGYILKLLLIIPYIIYTFTIKLAITVLALVLWIVCMPIAKITSVVEPFLMKVMGRFMDFLSKGIDGLVSLYKKALRWSVYHRKLTLLVAALFFVGSMATFVSVGMELLPSADQSQINISVDLPAGAVLERSKDITDQVLTRLDGIPEIKDVSTSISGSGGSVTVALTGMKDRDRTSTEIADIIRDNTRDIAGADITVEAVTSMMGTGSFSTGGEISYRVQGDDIDTLVDVAEELIELISGVSGTRDATSSLSDTTPQATIKVDRMKASSFGLSAATIMGYVNTSVSGSTATTLKTGGTEIDIRVGQPEGVINSLSDVENLLIPTPYGTAVPLREVADISVTETPMTITRTNQITNMSVYASLDGTRDLGSVSRDIDNLIANQYIFPQGVSLEVSGNQQTMNEEMTNLLYAFVLSIFLVYAIMAAEFESLYYPIIIYFAVPIALSAGVLGLFIMDHTFGITAALGMIMLLGIVVNNGIVLIDYINLLRGKGLDLFESVEQAGPVRLRAILMTTLTTALGLVPMMLGAQEGSEMMQPLATVVVWGLLFSTLVTLFVVPVIYIIFENARTKRLGHRAKFRKIEEV